jgi:hypothetical protein
MGLTLLDPVPSRSAKWISGDPTTSSLLLRSGVLSSIPTVQCREEQFVCLFVLPSSYKECTVFVFAVSTVRVRLLALLSCALVIDT